jgi:hypothetical protein
MPGAPAIGGDGDRLAGRDGPSHQDLTAATPSNAKATKSPMRGEFVRRAEEYFRIDRSIFLYC